MCKQRFDADGCGPMWDNFLWAPDHRCDIVNLAFSGYAKHTQEIEDIINTIVDKALAAGGSGLSGAQFSIELDDDFSDEDLVYIQKEVQRRL